MRTGKICCLRPSQDYGNAIGTDTVGVEFYFCSTNSENERNSEFMLERISARRLAGATCLLFAMVQGTVSVLAQGPQAESDAIRARVNGIIGKMTLDEKIDYIGGTGFAIRAVPRLNLPAFEMSDGPYGVRSNAGFPSTTYAAGIGLAATW